MMCIGAENCRFRVQKMVCPQRLEIVTAGVTVTSALPWILAVLQHHEAQPVILICKFPFPLKIPIRDLRPYMW
jgi:hypothetical protein